MKSSKNYLVIFLVTTVIVGFALIAIYSFYYSINSDSTEIPQDRLIYVANALMGLVGGIVASSFGVELPSGIRDNISKYNRKMSNVGNFVMTGKLKDEALSKTKTILGNIYVWTYFLIGLGAITIWILDDTTLAIVDNLATVSFGLMLIIVKNYFD